jgi:signal transduction histidine kinase
MIHTRFGGSGLGLFICKSEFLFKPSLIVLEITELLGGRVEVKSQLGEGSGEYPSCLC